MTELHTATVTELHTATVIVTHSYGDRVTVTVTELQLQ